MTGRLPATSASHRGFSCRVARAHAGSGPRLARVVASLLRAASGTRARRVPPPAGRGGPLPPLLRVPPPQYSDRVHPCPRLVASCSSGVPPGVGPTGIRAGARIRRRGTSGGASHRTVGIPAFGCSPAGRLPAGPRGPAGGYAVPPAGRASLPAAGASAGLPALALLGLSHSMRGVVRRSPVAAVRRRLPGCAGVPLSAASGAACRRHRRAARPAGRSPQDCSGSRGVPRLRTAALLAYGRCGLDRYSVPHRGTAAGPPALNRRRVGWPSKGGGYFALVRTPRVG